MGIGSRLLLLLAIPLAALLAVTGYGVYRGATQSSDASALAGRTDVALASYALVEDLQAERAELVEVDRTSPELRGAVEESTAALTDRAAAAGGRVRVETEEALRSVATARSIAERELGGAVALRVYSEAIAQLLDLSTLAIDPQGSIDDAPASVTDYLARAQAASAEERDLLTVLVADDTLDSQSFQEVTGLSSEQASYLDLAAANAPAGLAVQIRQVGFANSAVDAERRAVFAGESTRSARWIEGLDQRTAEIASLQRTAESGAVAAVDQLARNSRLLLALAALAAIAIVLVSALLWRRAVRSIARPLQQLATQAEEVARTRLPQAVATQQLDGVEEVHLPALRASGAAEVHDVAHAFNEVQQTALRLASEQAALRRNQGEALTNLGRRNQTLLARQLDFISSLETRETDPAFLDHLFKLDHLASRMRRNAESLLILAGSETPRRRRTPAPISEIVRAAMSEVEEFERVRIGNVRDATIAGPAVIDLIHLLAELIENALGFSPPDTTVEIDGRSLGQGGYQFAVIDHGVGMTDVELLAANHRLRGLDELEGMPTRYLGQYVVAKLAAKTGALVRLQPSAGGRGVTALVILPTSALVGGRDRDAATQPLPGSRAAREQGPVPFAPGAAVAPALDQASPIETAEVVDAPSGTEPAPFDPAFDPALDLAPPPPPVSESAAPDPFAPLGDGFEPLAPAGGSIGTEQPSWPDPVDVQHEEVFDTTALEVERFLPADLPPAPPAHDELEHGAGEADQDDPGLIEAVSWLSERHDVEPGADPWEDFLGDPAPAGEHDAAPEIDAVTTWSAPPAANEVPTPPPVPSSAPIQPGWVPAAAASAESAGSTDAVGSVPVDGGDTPSEPAPERVGSLTRRVPGASLAESRGHELGGVQAPAPARDADAVRSMLSSFQAGRHRGREADPHDGSDAEVTPSTSSGAEVSEAVPDSVSDGRLPQ